MKWEELSMSDRSNLMKAYLQNGVVRLSDMRDHYNKFVSGGPLRNEYDNPESPEEYATSPYKPTLRKVNKFDLGGDEDIYSHVQNPFRPYSTEKNAPEDPEYSTYIIQDGDIGLEIVAKNTNSPILDIYTRNTFKKSKDGTPIMVKGKRVKYISNNKYPSYIPSEDILKFIKEKEGYKSEVYKDTKGIKTIGYGFTNPKYLEISPMSREVADSLFINEIIPAYVEDFKRNTPFLNSYTQNEKDALFSYMYNIGASKYSLGSPSLQSALTTQDRERIIKEMNFGYSDSSSPGLRIRRDEERNIFKNNW